MKLALVVAMACVAVGCGKPQPKSVAKPVQATPKIDQVARFKRDAQERKMKWSIDREPGYGLMCVVAYREIDNQFLDCEPLLEDAARIAADQIEGKIQSYSDRTRDAVINVEHSR